MGILQDLPMGNVLGDYRVLNDCPYRHFRRTERAAQRDGWTLRAHGYQPGYALGSRVLGPLVGRDRFWAVPGPGLNSGLTPRWQNSWEQT